MPTWNVPADNKIPGDTGHTTDHNTVYDDLTIVNNFMPIVSGGLTGATQALRFVGATTSGHPASGTFAVGDVAVDRTGAIWICTGAGTPGTWTNAGGSGAVSSVFTRTGAVTAQTGDYTASQVGALPSTDDISAIASANATAGNWSNNSHKITSLANGSASSDAAAFGQIPTALPPNGAAGGVLSGSYPNPGLNVPLLFTGASTSAVQIETDVTGDSVARLAIDADGSLHFGSGSATADTSIKRDASGGGIDVEGLLTTGPFGLGVTQGGIGITAGGLLISAGGFTSNGGGIFNSGVISFNSGTDTSGTAAASSPTFVSGTALQVNTAQDVILYIGIKTAASLTVAIGPTSGVATNILPAESAALGVITLRVPKGWFVKLTGTMADLQITAITC